MPCDKLTGIFTPKYTPEKLNPSYGLADPQKRKEFAAEQVTKRELAAALLAKNNKIKAEKERLTAEKSTETVINTTELNSDSETL